jgi:hypothetical protein
MFNSLQSINSSSSQCGIQQLLVQTQNLVFQVENLAYQAFETQWFQNQKTFFI